MKQVIISVLVFILSGCAATRAYQMQTSNLPDYYTQYTREGTASIKGQTFLKTRGGDVKYGAGNTVVMVPVSPHTEEYVQVAVIQGKRVVGYTAPPQEAVHRTTADGEGRFIFHRVAPGEYFILCDINWLAGKSQTGGTAYKKIVLAEGEILENVVVTR